MDEHRRRNPRATGRSTLEDVARKAGVSMMTVSRALRDTGLVSARTVERVRSAALELNYVPDPAARALASARSTSVAVLIPTVTNIVFADLLEAVHEVLQPLGYQPLIGNTHYDSRQEETLLRHFMAQRPAGILISGFDHTEATGLIIQASGVPCVHMMELSNDPGIFSVGFSQQHAARTAVEHLISSGRRKIAFVGASMDPRACQRHDAYVRALHAAGLLDEALDVFVSAPTSFRLGGELFGALLARRSDVDAVFFSNDDLALGALHQALRLGVGIPDDVAVIGFNGVEQSAVSIPPLTTIGTPRSEIGRQAALMLLRLIRKQAVERPSIDLGFELVLRESA